MLCPFCGHQESKVLETRESEDLQTTRRRRECLKCEKRFTTYERLETSPLVVIKKDGRREEFDAEKLKKGIIKACEKTKVPIEKIDEIVEEIERRLRMGDSAEVESKTIGQMVARGLKKADKVAYIRFASVFRPFVDLEDFERELKKLL